MNDVAYSKKLPVVLLITVAYAVLYVFIENYFLKIDDDKPILYFAFNIINIALLFLPLGYLLNKMNAAYIAIIVFTCLAGLSYFTDNFYVDKSDFNLRFIINDIFFRILTPVAIVIFFVAAYGSKNIWRILLVVLIANEGMIIINYGVNGLINILDVAGIETFDKYGAIANFIFRAFCNIPILVLEITSLAYIAILIKNNFKNNRTAHIDIINDLSLGNATILFWAYKFCLILGVAGISVYIMQGPHTFVRTHGNWVTAYLAVSFFVTFTTGILLNVFIAIRLRKTILEFFFNYGFSSKLLFWILCAPVAGFLIWIFSLLAADKKEAFMQRQSVMENYISSSVTPIIILFLLTHVLYLFFGISHENTPFILSLFVSVILFFWYIRQVNGYNFMVGIYAFALFCVLCYTMYILLQAGLIENRRGKFTGVYSGFFLFSLAQMLLQFGIFHFEKFTYDVTIPDKRVENSDILAEYDTNY